MTSEKIITLIIYLHINSRSTSERVLFNIDNENRVRRAPQ